MPTPLHAVTIAPLAGIAHGFFSRHGGVSQGIYASLNCGAGSKDDPAAVRENRDRVVRHLGATHLLTCNQIHSAIAVEVDAPWPEGQRPKADAMVTRQRGIALGALAADCAPVLFAEAEAGVVGAAHAGWRGALGGVLDSTIAAMERLGARRERIVAAVGPCIGPAAYEVGWDFKEDFLRLDPGSGNFFSEPVLGQRPHFDLAGYAVARLQRAGVAASKAEACTYTQNKDYFSYRASRRANEPDYGRQISAIVLT